MKNGATHRLRYVRLSRATPTLSGHASKKDDRRRTSPGRTPSGSSPHARSRLRSSLAHAEDCGALTRRAVGLTM